jgi:phosphoglycolate phosphatase
MQKVVIFDMDGTLVDSKKDITITINYIRKLRYNLEPVSEELVVEAINMHERNLPYIFYGTKNYEQKDKELFEQHYIKQCTQNSYLYDGVKEMLQTLYDSDIKLSVATNASSMFAKRMLEHLKVAHLFDNIIGADMVEHSKPDPQMLNMILKNYDFKLDADKAWMIGDNSKDILSAKNALIDAVFVTWGFSKESECKLVAKEPKEVLDIVL